MALAELVAVYHGGAGSAVAAQMLKRVKTEVIDPLPLGSHVHLEMDWRHPDLKLPPRVKKMLKERNIFSQLAAYAKRRGHFVHWMETPERFLEMEHDHVQQLEKALETVEQAAEDESEAGPRHLERAVESATMAYNLLGTSPTGTHRTEGMQEHLDEKKWTGRHVAIGGAVHIQQLALLRDEPVAQHVHPFPDEARYQQALLHAVEQEKTAHRVFLKMRADGEARQKKP